jgi:hypothetical protein
MINHATRAIVATLGVLLAIGGLDHGLFEVLQGNVPTSGLIIQAIGDQHRMWVYGTEEALTVVPNFLATGLLAILVSVAIAVWSVGFVHTRHGATVFILLFVVLFLVGGGIGQLVFFMLAWLVATRIRRPLSWWRKALPARVRPVLARFWPATLMAGTAAFLFALEIAVFGYVPGLSAADPDAIRNLCWSLLLAALALFLVTFVAGFAHDLQRQPAG